MKLKKLLSMFLALVMVLGTMGIAVYAEDATVTALDDFEHSEPDAVNGTVTLTKYNGAGPTVVIPGTYNIDGTDYAVIIDAQTVFNGSGNGNTKIKNVTIQSGVEFLNNTMKQLFRKCTALTSVAFGEGCGTDVTDMEAMFSGCTKLTSLDLSKLNTSSVTTFRSMFNGCSVLSSLDLSNFDTSSAESMNRMFYNCKALTSLDLSGFDTSSVTDMSTMLAGCEKLTAVNLSNFDTADVTDMSYMFWHCYKLVSLDISSFDLTSVNTLLSTFESCSNLGTIIGLENFDTPNLTCMEHTFFKVNNEAKTATDLVIDLSSWDLSNIIDNNACFQNCKAKEIKLPDNLSMMGGYFLDHASLMQGTTFTIPSGVERIGYSHVFYDMATDAFVEFKVAEGNTNFKAVDGVLYSADGTTLFGMPRGKTYPDGKYEIEEGVTFLTELCFSRNTTLNTIVLPDSYVIKQIVHTNDEQYRLDELDTSNANSGVNSLSVATYIYTNITDYEVKDTNPNYATKEGILYSKDMTSLLAIPVRYDKVIDIPEGVTTWVDGAVWDRVNVEKYMVRSSGVNIPASMQSIPQEEMGFLNTIESRNGTTVDLNSTFDDETSEVEKITYTYDFTITVDEDNPFYSTDADGQLVAFGAALSEKFYVYDGTAKTPAVTVGSAGTILAEGTDYTVEYIDNINPGTAKVKITGIGNYAGKEIIKNFTIATDATIANTLKIDFVETTPVGAEGYITADIVVSAANDIQELNTADLTFKLDVETEGAEIAYEINATNPAIEINNVEGDRYEFHYKEGNENVENNIVIGQVKLSGYGKFDFYVAAADTNLVTATTVTNNIVTYFIPGGDDVDTPETEGELDLNDVDNRDVTDTDGDKPDDLSDKTIKVATRTLDIEIAFPNVVNHQVALYQDMKVTVTGGLAEVPVINLGSDVAGGTVTYGAETSAYTAAAAEDIAVTFADGTGSDVVNGYRISFAGLPMNTNYTITVEGAGYRTARYNVVLTENKLVKFWNNVMEADTVYEVLTKTDDDGTDDVVTENVATVNFLAGDIVEDNDINIYDLSAVVSYFAKAITDPAEYAAYVKYDLNRDGVIDSKDVAYVLVSWGN